MKHLFVVFILILSGALAQAGVAFDLRSFPNVKEVQSPTEVQTTYSGSEMMVSYNYLGKMTQIKFIHRTTGPYDSTTTLESKIVEAMKAGDQIYLMLKITGETVDSSTGVFIAEDLEPSTFVSVPRN